MHAIVRGRYGSPDVLHLREVERPAVGDDQVLVNVRASCVNAADWHLMEGRPYFARLSEGLRNPKSPYLGNDAAGVVEAVGKDVTALRVGDRVFGSRWGAFAEYVSGRSFVAMPAGLTFEQAAAVPTAGVTALQGLRDKARLQAGQRVLINGAGGGVGTFAVQIAKALGADVTATTSATKLEMVRSIGADHVVDYTREDVTRSGRRYDVILDASGNHSLSALRRVLGPRGTLVLVAPAPGQWIGPLVRPIAALVGSRFRSQRVVPFLARITTEDLIVLRELLQAGKLLPVIERSYPLAEVAEAIRYVQTRRVSGKVVISM